MSRNQCRREQDIPSLASSPARTDPDSSSSSPQHPSPPQRRQPSVEQPQPSSIPSVKNGKPYPTKVSLPASATGQLSSIYIAMITALLWTSSVLTFACAHAVALCVNNDSNGTPIPPEFVFILSIVALSIGSIGSGILSDRIGRTFTVRLCLIFGTLVTIGAVASHPDDAMILLILVAAAGAAAGGSHIAAELFFELLVNKWSLYYHQQQKNPSVPLTNGVSSSVYVLLCYPGLFFPIGLIHRSISIETWYPLVVATVIVSIFAILGSFLLPESTSFIKYKRAQIKAKIKYHQKLKEEEQQRLDHEQLVSEMAMEFQNKNNSSNGSTFHVPEGYRLTDDISGKKHPHTHTHRPHTKHFTWYRRLPCCPGHHYRLVTSTTKNNSNNNTSLSVCSSATGGLCNRSVLLLISLWFLFTVTYYLSSLTLFVVPTSSTNPTNTVCAIPSWRNVPENHNNHTTSSSSSSDRRLDTYDIIKDSSSLRTSSNASVDPSSSSYCTVNTSSDILQIFDTGIHLIIAEFFALIFIAFIMNTELLGRKQTVSSTFGISAAAMVFAAATNASLGCEGSITRIAVEFLLHLSLAACAQALFVYTLEVTASNIRSTINGIVIAVFRIGALLTLANGITSFSSSSSSSLPQLQWSVYALNYEESLFGYKPDTSSYNTAMAAVLAACAQICFACAALSSCLPTEPRRFPRPKNSAIPLPRESLPFRQRVCSRMYWIQLLTSFVYSIFRTGSFAASAQNTTAYQVVQTDDDDDEDISSSRPDRNDTEEDKQRQEDLKNLQKEGLELIQILGTTNTTTTRGLRIPTIDIDDDNDEDDDENDEEIQGIGGGIYITDDEEEEEEENDNDSSSLTVSDNDDTASMNTSSKLPKPRSSYLARVFRSEPRSLLPDTKHTDQKNYGTRNHRSRTESLEHMVNGNHSNVSSTALFAALPTLHTRIQEITKQHNQEEAVRLAALLDRYALILSNPNKDTQEQQRIALEITHLNMENMNEEYLHQEAARLRFLVRVWQQNS